MILHPPVMALSLAALLSAGTLSWAGIFSVQLLRHWNLASGARRQIELERRTYLIATTLTMVLALQGFALLLMVFNADAMAPLLIGAMCAFGTFNASVFGFPALFAKMALFFAAIVWLAMNHADVLARDYPLTRRKYALLLLIAPLGLADAGLSLAYFADLKTDTLTSCCGTVFNPEKAGLGGEAAALDPRTALILLAGSLGLTTALGWLADRRPTMAIAYGAAARCSLAWLLPLSSQPCRSISTKTRTTTARFACSSASTTTLVLRCTRRCLWVLPAGWPRAC